MPKLALPALDRRHGRHPVLGEDLGEYGALDLGEIAGLTQLGLHLEVLHPGAKSSVRHWHEAEDEVVVVLSGTLTLVEGEAAVPMGPGEVAAWAAGTPLAHRLENRGDAPATYLVADTCDEADRIHYPDHDAVLTREGAGDVYTRSDGTPWRP